MKNYLEEEIKEIFINSKSKSDVLRALKKPINGTGIRFVDSLIVKFKIDISHFDKNYSSKKTNTKYEKIMIECPVCSNLFETLKNHPRQKKTCSSSCSNSFFRSGENNPNFKCFSSSYRRLCFSKWEKKCIICGFSKIVEVHHLDKDRSNNDIENLIPLCPNHHKMIHHKDFAEETNKILLEKINNATGEQN